MTFIEIELILNLFVLLFLHVEMSAVANISWSSPSRSLTLKQQQKN